MFSLLLFVFMFELIGLCFVIDCCMCVVVNCWGVCCVVGIFFGVVSWLGDGVFWYVLMLLFVLFDG